MGNPETRYYSGHVSCCGKDTYLQHEHRGFSKQLHIRSTCITRRDRMTRGRLPVRAWKEADPIAEKRGMVQHYRHEPGGICDFIII